MRFVLLIGLCIGIGMSSLAQAQMNPRELKVREDLRRVVAQGFWIYNDLPQAFAVAEKTKKPIVVVLRCVPCEQCVKLDDELMEQDPTIQSLLKQFVCVRVVGTNGLDLSLFQYDTDQSFAIFFLNAEKTIYGRFGTRSHRTEWQGDVSIQGLRHALEGALELHKQYPENKASLEAKKGAAPEFPTPEKYPSLASKYTDKLNYEGNVVQSCIHCHQIGEAQRDYYRARKEPIPEELLFPYPHPKSLGLILDPETRATVKEVEANSWASKAAFQPKDKILSVSGQPILSMADVQWALHSVSPRGAKVNFVVERNGQQQTIAIELPDNWRRKGDLSWRASSWALRRIATGGMKLNSLTADERKALNVPGDGMALSIGYLGAFGVFGVAKKAGAQKDDVVVEFDGRTDFSQESDIFIHCANQRMPGDIVSFVVLRDGKRIELKMPLQP